MVEKLKYKLDEELLKKNYNNDIKWSFDGNTLVVMDQNLIDLYTLDEVIDMGLLDKIWEDEC